MTSLISYTKQVPLNAGYYINVGTLVSTFYSNAGTDDAPLISTNIYARSSITSTFLTTAGAAILRDMGKTLVSAGRGFRKVQLRVSTLTLLQGGTDAVGGVDTAPTNYITGYIEIPFSTSGTAGAAPGVSGGLSPVARLG
jgi:hypothetical protein